MLLNGSKCCDEWHMCRRDRLYEAGTSILFCLCFCYVLIKRFSKMPVDVTVNLKSYRL